MEKMWSLLSLENDEVRMVAIWGPAGIGKTIVARAVYEKLCGNFTHTAFMESIKVVYATKYLDNHAYMLHLQEHLLSETLNQKGLKICHLGVAHERLKDKKVLIVLDDVDRLVQLNAMADQPRWFGSGSRIIITTQDKKLLKAHGINYIYEVGFPADVEALQIFCLSAFGQKSPKLGFKDLAQEVTNLSGKLPLGLSVMGSYFRGMSEQEWRNELPRVRTRLQDDIKSILRLSYEALCDEDKDLFLYIACFFNLKSIQTLEHFLLETFVDLSQGLKTLAEKSLISREYGFIKMHNLLVQLGREIVRNQSVREPGQRQFLVDAREICEVLSNNTGSRSLVGMDLDLSEINGEFNINERSFKRMCNLQFLRFYGRLEGSNSSRLDSTQCLIYISPKLRLLHWDYFPMKCLPSSFVPVLLVELNMRHSELEMLWEDVQVQTLKNLKWMDLSYSKNLRTLPDLSTATNLLLLDLSHCPKLMELPSSIGNATSLVVLNIDYCSSLVKIPSSVGNIPNLKIFLSWCSSLVELPSCIWNITSLNTFNLENFSSSIDQPLTWGARNFQDLDLNDCSSLKDLPAVLNANNLKVLHLSGHSKQVESPSSIGSATNLERLNLENCSSLVNLPSSIGNATKLRSLICKGCYSLEELPSCLGNEKSLFELNLEGCQSLLLEIGFVRPRAWTNNLWKLNNATEEYEET